MPKSGYHRNEGGESGYKIGPIGFVGGLSWGVSLEFHWRLSPFYFVPRALLPRPLRTTFDHILRLSGCLSRTKFRVAGRCVAELAKALEIAAN